MPVMLSVLVLEDAHREEGAGRGYDLPLEHRAAFQASVALHRGFLPSARRHQYLAALNSHAVIITSAMSHIAAAPMAMPAQRVYQRDDRVQSSVSRPQASMKRSKALTGVSPHIASKPYVRA